MKTNPVVHFEMPMVDKKRTKKFYEIVFGWKMNQFGKEMGNYLLATTSPMTKNNMHKNKGAINGGFYEKGKAGSSTHFVIAVDNLEKQIQIVKKAGGKIQGKPQDINGIGKFVMILDTEGNRMGILQPFSM